VPAVLDTLHTVGIVFLKATLILRPSKHVKPNESLYLEKPSNLNGIKALGAVREDGWVTSRAWDKEDLFGGCSV
jgi:hypothetical protein